MINVLAKRFIKDYKNYENPKVRQSYGSLLGVIGIILNISLFAMKLSIGVLSGSISILADAFNNLSDMSSGVISLIGFKMSSKPADKKHPFGHGRIEHIAGQIVSFAIIIMGFELFKTSFEKIIHPEKLEFSVVVMAILIVSIFIKLFMGIINIKVAKQINAPILKATAYDSFTDSIATTVVLVATILQAKTGINFDGFAGILVAVFVIFAGIKSTNETIQPLLGQMPSEETVASITKEVLKDKKILGVHDLVVHDYGHGVVYAIIHIELQSDLTIVEAHEILDAAEKRVNENLNIYLSTHLDPVDYIDKNTLHLKNITECVVEKIDKNLKIHDFQVVHYEDRDKISFDVDIANDYKIKPENLSRMIEKMLKERIENIETNIRIDTYYVYQ